LCPNICRKVDFFRILLELLLQQIAELDRQRDAVLEDDAPDKAGEMIQQLATLRGIGVQSATVLVREAFVRDFATARRSGPTRACPPRPIAAAVSTGSKA